MVIPEVGHPAPATVDATEAELPSTELHSTELPCAAGSMCQTQGAGLASAARKDPAPARRQRSPTGHPARKLPARSGFYTQHWRPAWTYATADWRQTKSRPYQASDKKQYRRSTVAPRQTPSQ